MEDYTPFGHSDYQTIIAKIKKFAAEGKKTAVVSTINGDSNVPFYKELGNAGLKATDVPVVAFSVGEEELRGVDTKPLVGHLAAWNYFQSIKNPENDAFIKMYRDWAKKQKLPKADTVVTNDPMEATYIGIHMWEQAVEKAKSTDADKVIAAMAGQTFKAPSGFTIKMDEKNHHLHKRRVHRRSEGGRPVQRGVEDQGPGQGPALVALHRRQRQEEGRAGQASKPRSARRHRQHRPPATRRRRFFTEHENMRTLCFAFLLWFAALAVAAPRSDPATGEAAGGRGVRREDRRDPASWPRPPTPKRCRFCNRWPTALSRATDGGEITINNRVRGELAGALAALRLFDPESRRAPARRPRNCWPTPRRAWCRCWSRRATWRATARSRAAEPGPCPGHPQESGPAVRLAAVQALAISADPNIKSLLLARSEPANESRSATCAAPPSAPISKSRTA